LQGLLALPSTALVVKSLNNSSSSYFQTTSDAKEVHFCVDKKMP